MNDKNLDTKSGSSGDSNEALQTPVKQRYPRAVGFIIGNEFCERFSYYGMKNVLVLFMKNVLHYSEDKATEYYHVFSMLCYFTPIIGAYVADSILGKYKTIFYISFVYAGGNIVLSLASYLESRWVTWVGLALIALGTGGIKPCVSAFGADQFNPGQERHLQKFFSFFYISINAGSLISTIITPILRKDVDCSDRDDCFPLAFGVPCALMLVAVALFIIGRYVTHYKMIPPKKGNIVVTVICCVFHALGKKIANCCSSAKAHWLDYSEDKYDAKTITDIKSLMRVLFLYLPLPIFWALFDQQGSRWTLQATRMDGNFFGVYRFYPDQISFLNPLLIIIMVPLFEYVLYPLFNKINLLNKPLQKMCTGGILAAISFIICAFLQLSIESGLPVLPKSNEATLSIVNGLECDISITKIYGTDDNYAIDSQQDWTHNIDLAAFDQSFTVTVANGNPNCSYPAGSYNGMIDTPKAQDMSIIYIYSLQAFNPQVLLQTTVTTKDSKNEDNPYLLSKPQEGGANVKVYFNIKNLDSNVRQLSILFNNDDVGEITYINENTGYSDYYELDVFKVDNYDMYIKYNDSDQKLLLQRNIIGGVNQGGSYIIVVNGQYLGNETTGYTVTVNEIVKPNTVLMIWQVWQFIVITAGEIMFSVVGLEFSYSQAPKSMKSVLQAAWLLTVAFGNVIVAIVASAKFFEKQSVEFFFFAGLMIVDMALFAFMAHLYQPREITDEDDSDDYSDENSGSRSSTDSIAEIKKNNKIESNETNTNF